MQKIRNQKGQSMIEYALGIGCVAAVCIAAMGQLGHMSGDIFNNMQQAINYQGGPGAHGVADTGRIVNANQTPWNLQ